MAGDNPGHHSRSGAGSGPEAPRPLLKVALVAAFVLAAAAIFSQFGGEPDGPALQTQPAAEKATAAVVLRPSQRIVATWRYILSDAESTRRSEAETSMSTQDDPISAAMIRQLDQKLGDRMVVTDQTLTIIRGEASETWTWQTEQQSENTLILVLRNGSQSETRGEATFAGRDWLSLQLEAQGERREMRWRRVDPALPAEDPKEPASPRPPPAERP